MTAKLSHADAKLSASSVSLKIDQQVILSDINIELQSGKVLGVLGPNGAGKTSLLKMLSGQRQNQQQVRLNGRLLSDYPPQELAREIAVVNQLNDSVFALNLQQIVRMGLLPHKSLLSKQSVKDDKDIASAIDRVGLTDKSLQAFSSLSGGEQQRGLIARALVQKAALIVLDEPVNHLDVYYQHQVLQLLRTLAHKHNITVIMSLHDLNSAANYCDELCLLHQGDLVAYGKPEAVLTAERLEHVFNLPCKVRYHASHSSLRVDFYPPEEHEGDFIEGLATDASGTKDTDTNRSHLKGLDR